MKIDTRKVGNVCVVDISGKVQIGPDTAELRETSKELLGDLTGPSG